MCDSILLNDGRIIKNDGIDALITYQCHKGYHLLGQEYLQCLQSYKNASKLCSCKSHSYLIISAYDIL